MEEQELKRTLRRRKVAVRFADDADVQISHTLCESRRQEGKENGRRQAANKSETPSSARRKSLRQANEDCDSNAGKLGKIDEELPEEFTEKVFRPSALLGDDDGLTQVGFQTPRKRKSMVLKAQESASKYSSPYKADENLTPIKTPSRKDAEDVQCTPTRRVSFSHTIIGATPSKKDGTPTKSALKKRDSVAGTPSTLLHNTPSRKQQKPATTVEKTPSRLRSQTRALIQKSLAELESDDEDFSSDEDSFKPSDESSESSSESSMDEDDSPNKHNIKDDYRSKHLPTTAQWKESSAKFTKRNAKEIKDFEITTDSYFETQSAKQVTSNNTLSRLRTPRLQQDILHKLLDDVDAPHHQPITQLSNEYRSLAEQWLFSLWEGYSILLYGLGSKRHVLHTFHQEMLSNCNVLVVNGFFPGITIKNVVEDILTEFLDVKDVPSNILECVDVIESIQSRKQADPIYVLVHNLDGATFRNDRAQAAFSHLAQLPKVHLIASIDHINAPLLFDQAKLRRFNFVWWDVTTFAAYAAETSYESSLLIQQSGALALSSLNSVFKSLIPNAKKVFVLIAKNQLDHVKSQSFSGISFQDLYWKCRAGFLASSDKVLRAQLTEFLDHHLLKNRRGADGVETLIIPIESGILSQFLESQEQEGVN